jgi:hypothetical protein
MNTTNCTLVSPEGFSAVWKNYRGLCTGIMRGEDEDIFFVWVAGEVNQLHLSTHEVELDPGIYEQLTNLRLPPATSVVRILTKGD